MLDLKLDATAHSVKFFASWMRPADFFFGCIPWDRHNRLEISDCRGNKSPRDSDEKQSMAEMSEASSIVAVPNMWKR